MDSLPNPSEKLSRALQQLRANIDYSFQLLNKLPLAPKNQQHILEKDLRKLQNTIKTDFKALNDLCKSLEDKPPKKNPITGKELERRRNQINELGNLIKTLEQKSQKKEVETSPEKVPENRTNFEANEHKKSNKQLFEEQKEELKHQEKDIDSLLDSVTNIKHLGMNINNELDEEKGLLGELETHVDKNTRKLLDNNKKLEVLLEKVSNQCLICSIILEVMVIILLIMLF